MAISQARLDELWDFGDPAGSEARLREAMNDEVDDGARAELATQVARALGLQERFDDAHALLDVVPLGEPAVAARAALERGRLRRSAGDPTTAVAYFLAAVDTASGPAETFLRVDALHMLAITDVAQAQEWTAAALDVLEGSDDRRLLRWAVSLHNNEGWRFYDAGRFDDAVAAFERARDAAARWGTEQQQRWADEALAEAQARVRDAP